jgi:hypothetical protein
VQYNALQKLKKQVKKPEPFGPGFSTLLPSTLSYTPFTLTFSNSTFQARSIARLAWHTGCPRGKMNGLCLMNTEFERALDEAYGQPAEQPINQPLSLSLTK